MPQLSQPLAPTDRPWHAVTWLCWALAGTTAIQLASNPLYVLIVIGVAWVVVSAHGREGPFARAFPWLVAVAAIFGILRVVLTAATTHGGSDVLFTTPSFTLPEVLGGFTVGGTIETAVVVHAASEGLVIVGIVAVFAAFNAVVSHYELVQAAPRAFHELGLVVVVALAFVPSIIIAAHDVGEADRARTGGRIVRRGRLLRRLIPVLESGLERAITLSESLDSRGFAHRGPSARERGAGWFGALALLSLAGGFVALVAREGTVALVFGVVGAVGVGAAIVLVSGASTRVHYRRRRLTAADWLCIAAVVAAPALLGVISLVGDSTLRWPTDPLRWPSVHVLPALALLALVAPCARQPITAAVAPRPTVPNPAPAEVAA
jgi:energy-coupling factor transporter transmembrane protein EcfT